MNWSLTPAFSQLGPDEQLSSAPASPIPSAHHRRREVAQPGGWGRTVLGELRSIPARAQRVLRLRGGSSPQCRGCSPCMLPLLGYISLAIALPCHLCCRLPRRGILSPEWVAALSAAVVPSPELVSGDQVRDAGVLLAENGKGEYGQAAGLL